MRKLNLKDESGQTMILTLVCMTVLLGFVGFASDIGLMFRAKRNMQIAADSAAIAGAAELYYGDMVAAGQGAAVQNGITNGVNGAVVAINIGPTSGPFIGNLNYVEAIVTQTQPTFFAKLFNIASMNVSARAVATLGSGTGCIYTLKTGGTDLNFSGGANLSVPTCKIFDDSSMSASGGATVTAAGIGVVGRYSQSGGASVTPTPITGIVPVSDPLSYLPAPAVPAAKNCSNNGAVSGSNTLNPPVGCYNGLSASGSGTLNLSPGLYVVNGDVSISGASHFNGTGVTLYVTGTVSISGGAVLNLSAPTSGADDGLLIFQARNDASGASISGGANSTLEGILYFPDADASFSGGAGSKIYASFISESLNLSGGTTFRDYASINGSNVLTAAKLVE